MVAFAFRILLSAAIFLHVSFSLFCQSPNQYFVKAGQSIVQVLPARVRYDLPSFGDGNLLFKGGKKLLGTETSVKIKMNYDRLAQSLAYITAAGDTAGFVVNSPVQLATIGDDIYVYDNYYGYVHIIDDRNPVKLAVQQKWSSIRHENAGTDGYAPVSQTTARFNSVINKVPDIFILVNENTVFSFKEVFFLVDEQSRIYYANSAGFQRSFPSHKQQIKEYINKEKYKFGISGRDEVEKLLQFCTSFRSGEH